MQADNDLLRDIPALHTVKEAKAARTWIGERIATLRREPFEQGERDSFALALAPPPGTPDRDRFYAGILLADWVCYTNPNDTGDPQRMRDVVEIFPRGFQLWTCRLSDGTRAPVGYTGWYPITRRVFETMETEPERITHRRFMWPQPELNPGGDYIYLFNASIVPQLIGTPQSRLMMQSRVADLSTVDVLGLSSVAVSEHGKRVTGRLGLSPSGIMTHEGESETVMVSRFDGPTGILKPRSTRTPEWA